MATGQNVKYQITAEDRFSRVFSQLKSDLTSSAGLMGRFASAAGGAFLPLTAVATVAAGAGLALQRLASDIDALNDAADATGDSIENISALDGLARRNGASLQVVVRTVEQLNAQLRTGKADSPVARALKAIGIEARELEGASATEQLQRISKALAGYGDSTAKVRVQQTLFGSNLREIAPFLKDMAEDGQLVARVTSEQAAQAERFSKELSRLTAELTDTGRAVALGLLPQINELFAIVRGGTGLLDSSLAVPLQAVAVLGANVGFVLRGVGTQLGGLMAQAAAVASLDFSGALYIGVQMRADAKAAREEFDRLERRLLQIGQVPKASYSNEGRNARQPLGDVTFGAKQIDVDARKVTEAERLLETLRKQTSQYDKLGAAAKLAYDIQHGGIEGLTPALERELRALAQRVDEMSLGAIRDPLAGWKQEFLRSEKEAYAMLDRFAAEAQTRLGSAITDPQADQRHAFLRSEKDAYDEIDAYIKGTAATANKEFERLLETVEGFASGTTEAFLDMVEGADGSFSRLFKSFKRDLLRALIQDPIRDTMRGVVKDIRTELSKLDGADSPIKALFDLLRGGAEGFGNAIGSLFGSFFGTGSGFTGRASGGGVRAGELVRWQEHGREWFVPNQDGTVVTAAQMNGMGGMSFAPTTVVNVNGDVSPATVSLVRRMLDDRDARNMRSMRHGRAGA